MGDEHWFMESRFIYMAGKRSIQKRFPWGKYLVWIISLGQLGIKVVT